MSILFGGVLGRADLKSSRASIDPATVRPVNRVEAEIIALVWIGAGVDEQPDDIRVTEDNGEDESSLAAARPLIHIRAIGQ